MSHRGYKTNNNSGLLPSRPVFGGTSDSNRNDPYSSASLSEQINKIINGYLSEDPSQRQQSITTLCTELSKPLIGHHHHHSNRHERISIILTQIESDSRMLPIIRESKITQLLIKWLKGESLPHGYSGVNTKKAIMMLLPRILYKAYLDQSEWPLDFVTAYLWDVCYDGHWNDRVECICFTQIIQSILCDIDVLTQHYSAYRLKTAQPFLSQFNNIKKEALFKYEMIKNDQMTKFRVAMELCCFVEIRNDLYNNIERWFSLSNISHKQQIKFINTIYCTLQPDTYNDKALFADKLMRLHYREHCKLSLTQNLTFLFEAFPIFYELAIEFILNIKPSEKTKYALLLECIIESTPKNNLDLAQSRRRRKAANEIESEWMDSFAVSNEDDEEDDDDDDDDSLDGQIDDGSDNNNGQKMKVDKNPYGELLKMYSPSYILGAKMAKAREVHTHRKMCDDALKKFINVKKFDLCLFCESYLEYITEKSTTKVKKNGLTYLNRMAKHLIQAQYFMYRECKRQQNEIIQWKMQIMRAQDIITQSFVPLCGHFGFDHVCSLLFNFLLLSIFQPSNGKQGMERLNRLKVINFDEVLTINEQKKIFQSMPVAMATLDTLFHIDLQSNALEKVQIEQYLTLIWLLLERSLKFSAQCKEKCILYALYDDASNTDDLSIQSLLSQAMNICKYIPPSTINVKNCMLLKPNIIDQSHTQMIEKYLSKLGFIDFFMEIIVIFALFSSMSCSKFVNDLLKYPVMSHIIYMIILQNWSLPNVKTEINYDENEQIVQKFCSHFIAKEDKEESSSNSKSASPSPSKSPSKKYKQIANVLQKKDVKNLTILMYEDRVWQLSPNSIQKLQEFEAHFKISKFLWKYYLNADILSNILTKYDYAHLTQSFINHISTDYSMIHSQKFSDPILIIHAIFSIVQQQNVNHWRCLFELFKRIRIVFGQQNQNKNVHKKLIEAILALILLFDENVIKNGRHSTTEILDFPHLIFSAICQKTPPYIECNSMRIQLSSNIREQINPCKWLFDLRTIDQHLSDALNTIIRLLSCSKYTHFHLIAYINFGATCIKLIDEKQHKETTLTLYKFVVVICESLLTFPLAFGSLLQQNNVQNDIQKLVQFGMQNAKICDLQMINESKIMLLTLKDAANENKSFKCPLNVIICMLYIIAYCKQPLNEVSDWLTFIVSKQLKFQIVLDSNTINHLQSGLAQEIRWKLLLNYDCLQLYCFVYRISKIESLCNIIPFLLDHTFGGDEAASKKPSSAVQMVSWMCTDVMNKRIKYSLFEDKIKSLIVSRANQNIAIWKKFMTQYKTLFVENNNEKKGQTERDEMKQNVPMIVALFGNENDENESKHDCDVKMTDVQNEKLSENDRLFDYFVDAFNTNDQTMNMQSWSKLMKKLFVSSEDEKANIVCTIFDKLLNESKNHSMAVTNLVQHYCEYFDRLLCHCPENKQVSIRKKVKKIVANKEESIESSSEDEKKQSHPFNDWLKEACSEKPKLATAEKSRKRKWSKMAEDGEIKSDYDENKKDESFENLHILSKLGGFGQDLLKKLLKNTNDSVIKFKILSELNASQNRFDCRQEYDEKTNIFEVIHSLNSVDCADDIHQLTTFYHISDKKSFELVLDAVINEFKNDNPVIAEPPKKKARKLKIVLKKSPFKKKKLKEMKEPKKEYFATFIGDKLSENQKLFDLILEIENKKFRKDFIELCLESMCKYFYSSIRGEFMVQRLRVILNKYPLILMNLINVLAKHSKETLCTDMESVGQRMLRNREDWYFHHFASLICSIDIGNEYRLHDDKIKNLIDSMIVFLDQSPKEVQHLNESVYLTSLLLMKISKHYFHFFPQSEKLKELQGKFKETKMEKLWNVMQSLDRLQL